ncbi:hypothetical protein KQI22_09060 [Kineothrix sp. MSJ-39]|uniref:hypothetical protein n=1 Tax=Kineothrix sp. MSJ-39 TaxID=2841533 RepID=UPI001C10C18B|nr:hypothetical protein [Kineothrix sp. MSJ-39]MBU5430207.1 hypothetical protein [Kineothrix sp. MSJ-39]
MKLKKSDINILLIALGIAIAAISYFFVFTKLNEKTDAMKANNASLQQEVDRLQELANNKQQYLDDTATMQEEIENIKAQFAAAYKPEDEVLYVRDLEKNFDASAKTINMPGTTPMEVAQATVEEQPATDENGEPIEAATATADTTGAAPEILLYQTPVTVNFVASYNSIKEIVKRLNEDEMRKSVQSVSLAFDSETGDLTGTLIFNMYSLTGTDAVYTTPEIPGVVLGSGNIFNSADKKVAIEAEKAAQAKAAEDAAAESAEDKRN